MAETTSTVGPTLHHLNHSQSQRILWLLEELQIPYNLKIYKRQVSGKAKGRAPPELLEVHPLGKSPVLVTEDGRAIAESSAIALYLIRTYDKTRQLTHDDAVREAELCCFAGETIGSMNILKIVLDVIEKSTPSLLRPLVSKVTGGIDNAFPAVELRKAITDLEARFGDGPWLMGDRLGRADFVMSWPFDMLCQKKWIDINQYPRLKAWRSSILARDAWKTAMAKGNNEYNLDTFSD